MPFKVTSLALGQSYDCLSASEATVNIGLVILPQQTKHNKTCPYPVYPVYIDITQHIMNRNYLFSDANPFFFMQHIIWYQYGKKSKYQINVFIDTPEQKAWYHSTPLLTYTVCQGSIKGIHFTFICKA